MILNLMLIDYDDCVLLFGAWLGINLEDSEEDLIGLVCV